VSRNVDPEETAALAVLAELGRTPGSEDTRVISAEDEVEEVLRRLDLEAIGLLAYSLDPVAPPTEVREALLARLSGDSTQEVPPVDVNTTAAIATPALEEIEAKAPAAAKPKAPEPPSPVPFGQHAAARRSRSWAAPLAAVLALAAAGLGVWVAWLSSELASSQARVARLEREAGRADEEQRARIADLTAQVSRLEARTAFAATPAVTVFPLRSPSGAPQPLARGALYVAPDHQHWQLQVNGLAPTPKGREYQVWFLVDDIPLSGGCFAVEPDHPGTLTDARMPSGTTAVSITLEKAGGAPSPTGPVLLSADRGITL
jgi:hypothetical protein